MDKDSYSDDEDDNNDNSKDGDEEVAAETAPTIALVPTPTPAPVSALQSRAAPSFRRGASSNVVQDPKPADGQAETTNRSSVLKFYRNRGVFAYSSAELPEDGAGAGAAAAEAGASAKRRKRTLKQERNTGIQLADNTSSALRSTAPVSGYHLNGGVTRVPDNEYDTFTTCIAHDRACEDLTPGAWGGSFLLYVCEVRRNDVSRVYFDLDGKLARKPTTRDVVDFCRFIQRIIVRQFSHAWTGSTSGDGVGATSGVKQETAAEQRARLGRMVATIAPTKTSTETLPDGSRDVTLWKLPIHGIFTHLFVAPVQESLLQLRDVVLHALERRTERWIAQLRTLEKLERGEPLLPADVASLPRWLRSRVVVHRSARQQAELQQRLDDTALDDAAMEKRRREQQQQQQQQPPPLHTSDDAASLKRKREDEETGDGKCTNNNNNDDEQPPAKRARVDVVATAVAVDVDEEQYDHDGEDDDLPPMPRRQHMQWLRDSVFLCMAVPWRKGFDPDPYVFTDSLRWTFQNKAKKCVCFGTRAACDICKGSQYIDVGRPYRPVLVLDGHGAPDDGALHELRFGRNGYVETLRQTSIRARPPAPDASSGVGAGGVTVGWDAARMSANLSDDTERLIAAVQKKRDSRTNTDKWQSIEQLDRLRSSAAMSADGGGRGKRKRQQQAGTVGAIDKGTVVVATSDTIQDPNLRATPENQFYAAVLNVIRNIVTGPRADVAAVAIAATTTTTTATEAAAAVATVAATAVDAEEEEEEEEKEDVYAIANKDVDIPDIRQTVASKSAAVGAAAAPTAAAAVPRYAYRDVALLDVRFCRPKRAPPFFKFHVRDPTGEQHGKRDRRSGDNAGERYCMNKRGYHNSRAVWFFVSSLGVSQRCTCTCEHVRPHSKQTCGAWRGVNRPFKSMDERRLFATTTTVMIKRYSEALEAAAAETRRGPNISNNGNGNTAVATATRVAATVGACRPTA